MLNCELLKRMVASLMPLLCRREQPVVGVRPLDSLFFLPIDVCISLEFQDVLRPLLSSLDVVALSAASEMVVSNPP